MIAEQEAGAGPLPGGAVPGVAQPAAVERQAAAADAAVELSRSALSRAIRSSSSGRHHAEGAADLLQREADPLGGLDERQPPEDVAPEPALPAGGPGRADQPLVLVEPDGRDGQPRALRHLADGQLRFHPTPP